MSCLNKLYEDILEAIQIYYKKYPGTLKQLTSEPTMQAWSRLQLILGTWDWIHTWSLPATLSGHVGTHLGDTQDILLPLSYHVGTGMTLKPRETRSLNEAYNVTASTKKF